MNCKQIVFCFSITLLTACSDASDVARRVGIAAGMLDPANQPVTIDLLIDTSVSSTVTARMVDRTSSQLLPGIVGKPGSLFREWTLGEDFTGTRVIATFTSTSP